MLTFCLFSFRTSPSHRVSPIRPSEVGLRPSPPSRFVRSFLVAVFGFRRPVFVEQVSAEAKQNCSGHQQRVLLSDTVRRRFGRTSRQGSRTVRLVFCLFLGLHHLLIFFNLTERRHSFNLVKKTGFIERFTRFLPDKQSTGCFNF
jgi:hypothetical protein